MPPRRRPPRSLPGLTELAPLFVDGAVVRVQVGRVVVTLPPQAVAALRDVIAHLAAGDEVSVVARRSELTTQQAADLLGMSRQHLVRLIDAGRLKARATKVGKHRRVSVKDVLRLKAKREADEARAKEIADLFEETFGPAR